MLKKILLLMSSFTFAFCENTRNQSAGFGSQSGVEISGEWGEDQGENENDDKSSNYAKKKKSSKQSKSFTLTECELNLSLASSWQGLSLSLDVDGEEGDLCEALRKTEKRSAVVYFLDEDCEGCEQEIRNIYLAIQRNDFREDIGFIVIGHDEKESKFIEDQAPGSVFAIDLKQSFLKSIPDDIQDDRDDERFPLLLGLNGDLEYKFVHMDTYLEVVDETVELLQDFDSDVESDPIETKTSWDGDKHQGTGLLDVIPVH
ncbi:MAG: hypothetical protein AB8C84_02100 [Oligoflexales bacterium]